MLNKIKEMTGLKRVIFETLCAMTVVVLTYVITYSITGNIETSALAAFAAAVFATFVAVAFVAVAAVTAAVAAVFVAVVAAFAVIAAVTAAVAAVFVAVVAAFAVIAAVTAAVAFAAAFAVVAVAFAVVAAADIAREYKVRYHKALIICLIEPILLYLSFVYLVPYLSILVLVFTILFACALIGLAYLPEPVVNIVEPKSMYRGFTEKVFKNPRYASFYNKFVKETKSEFDFVDTIEEKT